MKKLKNITEAEERLIYIARGNNIEIDTTNIKDNDFLIEEKEYENEQIFNFSCLKSFLELISYLNININNLDKEDLHIIKNTLLAYHCYIKNIIIDCDNNKIHNKTVEKLQTNINNEYDTFVKKDIVKNRIKNKKLLKPRKK